MALWGKQDALAVTGTTIGVTNNSAAVTGIGTAFTTQMKHGDTLIISGVKYKVLSITSDTALTLASVYEGSTNATLAVASVKIQQSPKFLNTTEKRSTLGIDSTESQAGGDNVVAIAIQDGGTKYMGSTPGVTIAAPASGTTAEASATLTGGSVTSVTITATGTGYTSAPAVTVQAPHAIFNGETAVDDTDHDITITGHRFETGDEVVYDDGGGTTIVELTDGETYYVVKTGANTIQLAATLEDAQDDPAVTIDITQGAGANHKFTLTSGAAVLVTDLGSGEPATITNPGWVLKTVGQGGRAGRVQYETLVAGRSLITGDAADDLEAPDA